MTLALTLLRAAHARGTHHHLALDALGDLACDDAAGWRRLMHAHIAMYCDGAKAPDTAFKDFQNHVLHPRDGFWGGAPEQAQVWYGELVAALRQQSWPTAAYNAGVLSHYVTDPLMPLHTHQSEAENAVHAALEWTVSKSYADLRALGLARTDLAAVTVPTGSDWLRDLLRAGAQRATGHYETLLTHYDFKRGVVVPEDGLDTVGRRAIAEMVIVAARTFALVLDRAIAEAAVAPPAVDLTSAALSAVAALPKAWWDKRQIEKGTRTQIEAMYDELMATGKVETNLTEDERCIRALYAKEVGATRSKAKVLTRASATIDDIAAPLAAAGGAMAGAIAAGIFGMARAADPHAAAEPRPVALPTPAPTTDPAEVAAPAFSPAAAAVDIPAPAAAVPVLATYRPSAGRTGAGRLTPEAGVVEAPSIGPKTAQRLNDVGIDTVADFLAAHPIALAARLETAHITADVLTEWQDQTRLMLTLPGLRTAHAQLLTGSGYRTIDALARVEADQLAADVLHFALGIAGQRVLRQGEPPKIEQIRAWAEDARALKAA